jgi:zona occludens toxin (predicted ATPase)
MSKHPLSILPVKKHNKKPEFDLPEVFPSTAFSFLITAVTKSGKSVGIVNLLYNDSINFKKQFPPGNIFYISPTVQLDDTLKAVMKDDDIVKIDDFESLDNLDTILSEIVKEQKETPEDERENVLIILDDCISYLKSKVLANLTTKNRHYRISLVITTQSFRAVNQVLRKNATCHLFYKMYNKKEIDAINEEILSGFEDGLKYYKIATEKPYSFLYANCRQMELYERFENKLWSKY